MIAQGEHSAQAPATGRPLPPTAMTRPQAAESSHLHTPQGNTRYTPWISLTPSRRCRSGGSSILGCDPLPAGSDIVNQGRGGGQSGPREMHPATCSDCGTDTEVPFKPSEGRPVYCNDCFQKQRGSSSGRGGGRGGGGRGGGGRGGNREMHDITCDDCGADAQVPFKPTGDKPVYCRDCFSKHKPPRRDF